MEDTKQKVINLYLAAVMAKLTKAEHDLIEKNAQELIQFIEDNCIEEQAIKEEKPKSKKKS